MHSKTESVKEIWDPKIHLTTGECELGAIEDIAIMQTVL